MTQDEIFKMLKSPPRLGLKGMKKYVLEAGAEAIAIFGIVDPKKIKFWAHAASVISAKGMISRKFHPERSAKNRLAFVRNYWSRDGKVVQAMEEAGVKEWQKTLEDKDPLKKAPRDAFQFYVSIHTGYSKSLSSHMHFPYESRWDNREQMYSGLDDTIGINKSFLVALERGERDAVALAQHGYHNVLVIDGDTVVFLKLPKEVHLEMIRGRAMLSNSNGPARITRNGNVSYWFRGVEFPEVDNVDHWSPRTGFKSVFKNGKIKMPIKDILQLPNVEQRRVLMETFDPEEIAKQCPSKLLDGPTAMGNELLMVDIGLRGSYRDFRLGDDLINVKYGVRERTSRPNWVYMLRYTCPSTDRVYTKFVPWTIEEEVEKSQVKAGDDHWVGPNGKTIRRVPITSADQAQAWSHHFTIEQYYTIAAQS